MQRNKIWLGVICSIAITMMISSQANAQILFDFPNGSEFDNNAGIGAARTVMGPDGSSATVSLVDVFAPEFVDNMPTANVLRASLGDAVTTQIQSDDLGVDNPSVEDEDFFGDAGNENRDINDREGIVIEFDVPVIFTEIDFGSLDGMGVATVTIEGIGSFDFRDDANFPLDIFPLPFGTGFIQAGADITIEFSSPVETDANLSLNDFTVVTSTDPLSLPNFDFNNGTDFSDGQGIGATTTATSLDGSNSATMSIVDLFAPEFDANNMPTANILRASQGDMVVTQVGGNSLGVDNPSVSDENFFNGAGIENRDIGDREGLIFEFDVPVIITSLDLVSLDDGTVNVDIEGVGAFTFNNDDDNPTDEFSLPFGTGFIPAGANITISLSSPNATDANVRIQQITVSTVEVAEPCLLGDVDMSGTVDFRDIVPFIRALSSGEFQCEADIDESGAVDFRDIVPFIAILSAS